jgi:hypothetical protein
VPVKATVCGLPVALSATDSDALRAPVADGVKVTLIMQFAPAATLVPQLLVCAKLVGFVPVREMLVIVKAAVPVFDNVTGLAALVVFVVWFPNANEVGEKLTAGVEATPVPVRATVCGLPVALSATDSDALRAPVAAGLKVTLMVQFAPAAKLVPQVLVCAKSAGFVPVNEMLLIANAAVPVFESVTVFAALVVLTV